MPIKVEKVTECCELGEGPHWDVDTQSLFYVDIFKKAIHKYTPVNNQHTKATFDKHVSFIIPIEAAPNKFLISLNREITAITWNGIDNKVTNLEKIAEVDTQEGALGNRLNDGKCDASGRLWCGTMGPEPENGNIALNKGTFYSVDSNGLVKPHVHPVSISNGLAWNADNTKYYYIDSGPREVYEFNFDMESGTITDKKVIFSFEETGIEGFPDGQTIDTDGNLWVAVFNGCKVIKIDPRKNNCLLETIEIPAKQITSVAFGGPNLDELYVTSASFTVNGVVLSPPNHGAVFKVTGLGVKGYPAVKAKIA